MELQAHICGQKKKILVCEMPSRKILTAKEQQKCLAKFEEKFCLESGRMLIGFPKARDL